MGCAYQIIIVCRVSSPGPGKQDPRSLDDQESLVRSLIAENIPGQYEVTMIRGSGSGELLDRKELLELIDRIETGRYDIVFCEDTSRISRRMKSFEIFELCEDHNTRLIALNDHVDTANPSWRDVCILATLHHERCNRDTSDRIKRSHRNRFIGGACLRNPPYGWTKPPGAKSDADMSKDAAAEPNLHRVVPTAR